MRLTRTQLSRLLESDLYTTLRDQHYLSLGSSFFEDVDGCDVKALLGGVLKLVANRNESALVFGSAFHKAMDAYYSGKTKKIEELVQIALEEWRATPVLEDLKRNPLSLKTLVESYVQNQLFSVDLVPILHEGKPCVERGFETVLATHRGYELRWQGKIDMIVKEKGEYWVVDHKTTSMMGDKFADDKFRSNQMVGYTMLARQVLGIPVKGVIINAAAFRTSKGVVSFDFQRFHLPISEHAVYEWAEEVAYKLGKLLELLLSLEEYAEPTRYTGSDDPTLQLPLISTTRSLCVTKYAKCKFFDVCQAFISQRDALLFQSGEFKVSTHSSLSGE